MNYPTCLTAAMGTRYIITHIYVDGYCSEFVKNKFETVDLTVTLTTCATIESPFQTSEKQHKTSCPGDNSLCYVAAVSSK